MKYKSSPVVIITLCVIVLAVGFAVVSLLRAQSQREANIPELPTDTPVTPSEPVAPNDLDYSQLVITPDNVVSVIAALRRPTQYYYETESELFYSGGSSKYLRRKWERAGWQRVDLLSGTTTTAHTIYGAGKVFLWRPNDRNFYMTNAGDFTADNSQMMMVYEDILTLKPDEILAANFTVYQGHGCIYVEAKSKAFPYTQKFWVSTETGLLIAGQAQKGGTKIYSVKALSVNTNALDDSVFKLPNGNYAWNEV